MPLPVAKIAPDDKTHWAAVRAQYAVSPVFITREHGFFGMQATPVREAFQRYQAQLNRENSYFLRVRFPERLARVMRLLADFTGAEPDELFITRNPMESFNILIQGYPFAAGDPVLLADHDYDSVIDTLEMVAVREQLAFTRVSLPLDQDSDEQIVAIYEQAITPSTKVILVTHLLHCTCQVMPVQKIAAMARRHGIHVMVDAAHSFAQLDYRLVELGADFVVNLYRWLGAPLGVGLLYIRRARIADIAPPFGDVRPDANDIGKLGHVGTVPPVPILAVEDVPAFHHWVDARIKEAHHLCLTQYWLERVRDLSRVRVPTPRAPRRSCAIAAFAIDGIPAAQVVEQLMGRHRIFTVVRNIAGIGQAVRVTPYLCFPHRRARCAGCGDCPVDRARLARGLRA